MTENLLFYKLIFLATGKPIITILSLSLKRKLD